MTVNDRTLFRIKLATVGAVGAALAIALATPPFAHAEPVSGCVSQPWGLFGTQQATFCDSPIGSDGGWDRAKTIFTPAHQVPMNCWTSSSTGGWYSNTQCSGGYRVQESHDSSPVYRVFPDAIPFGEPGHIVNDNN